MEERTMIVGENKEIERSIYMMKKIGLVMICLIALSAVSFAEGKHGAEIKGLRAEHKATQQAENASFRESLKGKTAEERTALKAEHRTQQQAENQEFKAQMEAKKAAWKAEREQKKAAKATATQEQSGTTAQ